MTAKQKIHQLRLTEWSHRFADQKASGLTIRQWCDRNQVSFHAFNYWKHQLKEAAADSLLPEIVPLSLTSAPVPQPVSAVRTDRAIRANSVQTVSLTINGVAFEIEPSVPEAFLASLIRAVRYA